MIYINPNVKQTAVLELLHNTDYDTAQKV